MKVPHVDFVIVGDLAFDQTITPKGSKKVIAGAVYNVAIAASTVAKKGSVGVVAKVGDDFAQGITALKKRGIDTTGIYQVKKGKTSVFTITQYEDNTRKLSSDLGVGGTVSVEIFPTLYTNPKHVHLASSNPKKYLLWIPYLRRMLPKTTVFSVDGNDFFLKEIKAMKKAFELADMIFANELELQKVQDAFPNFQVSKPIILKKGRKGAMYIDKKRNIEISIKAPKIKVVDTSGAGDALAGVFLTQQLLGLTIEDSLQTAVHTASKVVTDFGVDHIING